jgi:hypothetical protein
VTGIWHPSRAAYGHLVLLRADTGAARAACAKLVERVRPMLARMSDSGLVLDWWLGECHEADAPATQLGLALASDVAWVLFVAVLDEGKLGLYYADEEHGRVREQFYRDLPALQELWQQHDRAERAERHAVRARIEEAAAACCITRIDLRFGARKELV